MEREIKLQFSDAREARLRVLAAGSAPHRPRRLQRDALLDTADGQLRARRSALRVRIDDSQTLLTFKGPVQPSAMKLREEIETVVADADALFSLLERLGYGVWFRYEKYREEFTLNGCVLAIDETPAGTYLEIEGEETGIAATAQALGRSTSDYILDSYRGVYVRWCAAHGVPAGDMIFASLPPAHASR